jgi:predicted deacylase
VSAAVAGNFAGTYAEARRKFLAAARARGLSLEEHVHPEQRGAEGEPLSIDVARLGPEQSRAVLVLTSGTHGVEGFCGSGCQVSLLDDSRFLRQIERAGITLLMIHAVNPFGFSHLRRVNEDNVDLNRNFISFDRDLPVNEGYAGLHSLLLPDEWPASFGNKAWIGAWIASHGLKAFQAAVSAGQYQFPDGLFFGGQRATWSNVQLRSILREHVREHESIGWIDFHTGLGPRGHGEKIHAGHDDASDYARACQWWGEVTSPHDGSSTSARVTGVACGAAYDECPSAQSTMIALEYGTVPIERVFEALRADHWLHNHPEAAPAQCASIGSQMRDAFYIDADDWKESVYEQALTACMRAAKCLTASPALAE